MSRRSFSRKDRARIFALGKGCCHLCSGKIGVGEAWEVEHLIPWAISRDDSDDNLRPAHKKCHAPKTVEDVGVIAKLKRIEAKHNGSWPRSKAKIKSRGFASTRSLPASEKDLQT